MAMPAMTAKAANRLPRTPHRGRKKPNTLPRPKRTVITRPRRYRWKKYGRQYRGSQLIKLGKRPLFAQQKKPTTKKAGDKPAFR
jgi:hypothetical protein